MCTITKAKSVIRYIYNNCLVSSPCRTLIPGLFQEKIMVRKINGIILIIVGVVILAWGLMIFGYNQGGQRDAEGFSKSNPIHISTSAYAYNLEISSLHSFFFNFMHRLFGNGALTTKISIQPTDPAKEIFAGLTTSEEGKKYASSMENEGAFWRWRGIKSPGLEIISSSINYKGLVPSDDPRTEKFWQTYSVSSTEAKVQYCTIWENRSDDKYLVIMNQDGSGGVEADIYMGFKMPVRWLQLILIPLGALLTIGGILLISIKLRANRK